MKKIIGFLMVLICILIGILALYETEVIRTYKIEDFKIDAVINKDGSMTVKETTKYRFNGKYNGITITIPEKINEEYYDKMTENGINDSELKDSWYNNDGISNVKIYTVENEKTRLFNKIGTADIGDMGVYTEDSDNGYVTYTIYEPAKNENKTFVIEYTLKDVAVAHNDVGEVWWNFIGGGVGCKISKLNLNISTSNGTIIEGYIHSNESGKINYINKNNLSATVSSIGKNEFVGVRLVFPRQNIAESSKISGINAKNIINEQEKSYDSKTNVRVVLNVIAIVITSALVLYWIYLLIKYEKEVVYLPYDFDELSILEKYNPMIAACIAQNRDMHPRDILAVLIDLVNRKVLEMDTVKTVSPSTGKVLVTYKLKKKEEFFKDAENKERLDSIERNVLDIFFSGNDSINLESKLNRIKTDRVAALKIKRLDEMVTEKLESIGANYIKIPTWLLAVNNIIFAVCMIFIFIVIGFNITLNFATMSTTTEQIGENVEIFVTIFGGIAIFSLPLLMYIVLGVLKLVNFVKKIFSKIAFKLTSQKITQSIISQVILFILIFVLEFVFFRQSYVIICTLLFMIALLIILTDNLMSSHSLKIRNDFFYLKAIQDKIENGSLLEDKNVEDNILWGKYLSFAIALGVGDVANFVKFIPSFDYFEECIEKFENIYDTYYESRNDDTNNRLERFEKIISDMLDSSDDYGSFGGHSSSNSFGGSSSSGSSFGGGGFSGGGGRRRPDEERFKP